MSSSWLDKDTVKIFCTGAACALVSVYLLRKAVSSRTVQDLLVSLSGIQKGRTYCDQELQFQYAVEDELPFCLKGQPTGSEFVKRCVLLCEKYTACLQDFTGEAGDPLCIDIGCSVGSTTFELSKCFPFVLGIDPSEDLISAADELKQNLKIEYQADCTDGTPQGKKMVLLDPNSELDGVKFMVADPCALPSSLAPVDCILAVDLLERLESPKTFLKSLPSITKPNGTVVLVSTYEISPQQVSSKDAIDGGKHQKDGLVSPEKLVSEIMNGLGFKMVHEEEIPAVRKIHFRKYEFLISHATVWKNST